MEGIVGISKEAKTKIAARCFYDDNREDYESYDQAVKEAAENMSEAFMDTVVNGTLRGKPGHRVLYRERDGHVAMVRTADDFFEPITAMTKEDGEELETEFDVLAGSNDNERSAIALLQECGWVLA